MRFRALALLTIAVMSVAPDTAFAARIGIVDVEAAEVFKEPQTDSEVSDRVGRRTAIEVSNQPTQGFYKVRLRNGRIGWMKSDVIVFDPRVTTPGAISDGAVTAEGEPLESKPEQPYLTDNQPKKKRGEFALRGMGGLGFFSAESIGGVLGLTSLSPGYSYGGQLEYFFWRDFSILLRLEKIFKTAVTTDARGSSKSYQHDLAATPWMLGFEVEFAHTPRFHFDFMVGAGLAPNTSLTTTSLNEAEPNVTVLSESTYTGLAKIDVNYSLSKDAASPFLEMGWRMLKTNSLTPSVAGNGKDVYQVNNQYVPVEIDMSGLVLGVGLVIYL